MAVGLYMDHHVPRAIAVGLRLRSVDVLTAAEDGTADLTDPELLNRATALGRALVAFDEDLLVEAAQRQATNTTFGGIIYTRQLGTSFGACIDDLELIATIVEPDDGRNQVIFLPL